MSAMTMVHSVNQAFLALILHELRQGHWNRCRDLGLPDSTLLKFQQIRPEQLSRLVYSSVPWMTVQIDEQVFWRIAQHAPANNEDDVIRALRLGATSQMMLACFGITHSDTAHRRRLLGIDCKRGRVKELPEEARTAIFQRWEQMTRGMKDLNEQQALRVMMEISEELNISLAYIWAEIRSLGCAKTLTGE